MKNTASNACNDSKRQSGSSYSALWGDLEFYRKFAQGHSERKITLHYAAVCDGSM